MRIRFSLPYIKEEDFAVLYSDKASRPNTPVNVIIGALILKELLGLTADEIMESLMFDIRFQYALHTTSFEEQPLSDRTLQIAGLMGIKTELKRMDSMMVASNIKKLSRLELLYTCAANIIEDVGEEASIISDYDYQVNTHSDSQFLKDSIELLGEQTKPLILVADGAYGGEENIALSKEKNIDLVTTNFQGKKPEDIFADFEFSHDGKKVLNCAGGQVPATNRYNSQTEQYRITLNKEKCNRCPYKDQCKPKFHKTKTSKVLSWKTVSRAKQLRYMKTSEFKEWAKIRNGLESLLSILRRRYRLDEMPVRGKLQTKLFFGFKVAALNFKKLFDYLSGLDKCTLKPEFC